MTLSPSKFTGALLTAALLAAAAVGPAARAADPDKPAAGLQSAWADLSGTDEAKATRAALALASSPKETLEFLKENLRPVKADAKLTAKLVRELDGDDFEARERAQRQLEYLGKYIKDDLKKALDGDAAGAEGKRRVRELLEAVAEKPAPAGAAPNLGGAKSISVSNVNGKVSIIVDGVPLDMTPRVASGPTGPPRAWVRAARAVGLLEHLNTPEARRLLEDLAAGEADALPTTEAKAALERLGKK